MANKLYTEEQIRKAYKSGFGLAMETDGGLKEGQQEFINSLTPIELPTDEEIVKRAKEEPNNSEITESERIGYIAGAKWLKDKILNNGK